MYSCIYIFFFNRSREALKTYLPEPFRQNIFEAALKEDPTTKRLLAQLLEII